MQFLQTEIRVINLKPRYIKVKVKHYLLFMFSPLKISCAIWGIKYIFLQLPPVFYLIKPSSKQIICFDFQKQNSALTIVFYAPCLKHRRTDKKYINKIFGLFHFIRRAKHSGFFQGQGPSDWTWRLRSGCVQASCRNRQMLLYVLLSVPQTEKLSFNKLGRLRDKFCILLQINQIRFL